MTINNKHIKGQSFFEVIIALALISIVLIAIVALASTSIRASVFSRNQTIATKYTEQAAEWLRGEKNADWNTFKTHATTRDWCLSSLIWGENNHACAEGDTISGTIFIRSVAFTIIPVSASFPSGGVSADVSTLWEDAQGIHAIPTSLVFTNY